MRLPFFFSLFSPHSFSFPLSLSHLHAASTQALWCACFNLELNGICGTAVPIGGRITDPRVHCGMPPFWWVGVKIAVKQWRRACSPRRRTAFPMQIPEYRKPLSGYCQCVSLEEIPSVAPCYTNNCWLNKEKQSTDPFYWYYLIYWSIMEEQGAEMYNKNVKTRISTWRVIMATITTAIEQ